MIGSWTETNAFPFSFLRDLPPKPDLYAAIGFQLKNLEMNVQEINTIGLLKSLIRFSYLKIE